MSFIVIAAVPPDELGWYGGDSGGSTWISECAEAVLGVLYLRLSASGVLCAPPSRSPEMIVSLSLSRVTVSALPGRVASSSDWSPYLCGALRFRVFFRIPAVELLFRVLVVSALRVEPLRRGIVWFCVVWCGL